MNYYLIFDRPRWRRGVRKSVSQISRERIKLDSTKRGQWRLFGIKVGRDPSVLEQCRMQFNSVFSVPRTGSTCFLRGRELRDLSYRATCDVSWLIRRTDLLGINNRRIIEWQCNARSLDRETRLFKVLARLWEGYATRDEESLKRGRPLRYWLGNYTHVLTHMHTVLSTRT